MLDGNAFYLTIQRGKDLAPLARLQLAAGRDFKIGLHRGQRISEPGNGCHCQECRRRSPAAKEPEDLPDSFPQRQQEQATMLDRIRQCRPTVAGDDFGPHPQALGGSRISKLFNDERPYWASIVRHNESPAIGDRSRSAAALRSRLRTRFAARQATDAATRPAIQAAARAIDYLEAAAAGGS